MPYRVLALDGGGARALIPAALLQRLQQEQGFLDSADVFAGTSTSGITALMLAAGADLNEASDAARTFWVQARKLFSSDSVRDWAAVTGKAAYFNPDALESAVKEVFGDRTVGELKRKVVIPTVALRVGGGEAQKAWCEPEIIQNFDTEFSDLPLREAALRAAAMPVFFPVRDNRIDGSLLANNPSLCAVAQVLRAGASSLTELRVLSFGAGLNPIGIGAKNSDWGYADWLFDHERPLALLQIVVESASSLTDFQCGQLLSKTQYHRINPQLPEPSPLDERSPRFLVAAGDIADETDLAPVVQWLTRSDWTGRRASKSAGKSRVASA
jgi:uncharacterized protein